jgi:hypothetical protein
MSPLVTALLCFGAFVILGLIAKVALGTWMKRQGPRGNTAPERNLRRRRRLDSRRKQVRCVRCRKIARRMKVARGRAGAAL